MHGPPTVEDQAIIDIQTHTIIGESREAIGAGLECEGAIPPDREVVTIDPRRGRVPPPIKLILSSVRTSAGLPVSAVLLKYSACHGPGKEGVEVGDGMGVEEGVVVLIGSHQKRTRARPLRSKYSTFREWLPCKYAPSY